MALHGLRKATTFFQPAQIRQQDSMLNGSVERQSLGTKWQDLRYMATISIVSILWVRLNSSLGQTRSYCEFSKNLEPLRSCLTSCADLEDHIWMRRQMRQICQFLGFLIKQSKRLTTTKRF